jgi:hypothetical protein
MHGAAVPTGALLWGSACRVVAVVQVARQVVAEPEAITAIWLCDWLLLIQLLLACSSDDRRHRCRWRAKLWLYLRQHSNSRS